MPRSAQDVAIDMHSSLLKSDKPVVTWNWEGFYDLNEITKLKEPRKEALASACQALGAIIGFGQRGVILTHDSNHSPAA